MKSSCVFALLVVAALMGILLASGLDKPANGPVSPGLIALDRTSGR